jgi:hypothetical protein
MIWCPCVVAREFVLITWGIVYQVHDVQRLVRTCVALIDRRWTWRRFPSRTHFWLGSRATVESSQRARGWRTLARGRAGQGRAIDKKRAGQVRSGYSIHDRRVGLVRSGAGWLRARGGCVAGSVGGAAGGCGWWIRRFITNNLLSVSELNKVGYKLYFTKNRCYIYEKEVFVGEEWIDMHQVGLPCMNHLT